MRSLREYKEILKNKNYFFLWIGQLLSNTGTGFTNTVLVMYLASKFQSGKIISFLLLVNILPVILLGPISGVFADRFDKRKIMIISDILRAALIFGIPFIQNLYLIYLAVFGISMFTTFFMPCHVGIISGIVEKEELMTAHSFNSITRSLCNFILGASLGAIIYNCVGVIAVFSIDSVSYILSALFIFLIRYRQADEIEEQTTDKTTSMLGDFIEGMAYLKSNKTVFYCILATTILMLTGGAINVLMVFVIKNNYLSPNAYGYILSSNGIGALIGSFLVNEYKEKLMELKKIMIFFIIMGISNALFAVNTIMFLGILLFVINGFCNQFINIPLFTVIQTKTQGSLIGRVASMQNILATASSTLSMIITGVLIDIYSSNLLFLITAIILILNGFIGWIISSKIRTEEM